MTDSHWMLRALDLARSVLGTTSPNPSVGAVIVRDGQFVAEGCTQPVGQAHAEVVAIQAAQEMKRSLDGCTMYVTLEPCCHQGLTAPCTRSILDAGISRVVIGTVDPYISVRGGGIRKLREHGVQVDVGLEQEQCLRMIRGFHRACLHGLPEVTCKAAISLDGRISTAAGQSQWITGTEARKFGHQLRAMHDAILVGIGTVLEDNPKLTCRVPGGKDPVPVVLDTHLRIPADSALLHGNQRAIIICGEDAAERSLNAEIVRLPVENDRVPLVLALGALVDRNIHRVLVEGGGVVHRSMVETRLVDTLALFVASTVIPGGRPWLAGSDLEDLNDAPRFGPPVIRQLGDDVLLQYELVHQHPMTAVEEE